ncbi:hypothetical protein CEP51_012237 [Fusarium floridanum]|uniref:Uncharacterized protein n=1 Tax=Fusarium floridanum TaxID=1325733 RepID=A0A428QXT5_9HYPO|nr:hypothetical protein CEP51_012237 [Fusarium floridanum]
MFHERQDCTLHFFPLAIKKFAPSTRFESFQSRHFGVEDQFVNGLNKLLMKLLAPLPPIAGVGHVNAVEILVMLDEGADGIFGELVGDLVAQNHTDTHDVSLNLKSLATRVGLDKRK